MDLHIVLTELKKERQRIDRAIEAIESLSDFARGNAKGTSGARNSGKSRTMSAAARKRISQMMKLRWAERKKAA